MPAQPAHVRSYFPEALYINPEIITDKDGRASIVIPIADSITTWRMAMIASTAARRAGHVHFEPEGLSGFLCRSRSARHAHPGRPGFDPGGHLQLLGRARRGQPEAPAGRLVLPGGRRSGKDPSTVDSGRVGGSQFTLEAKRIGKFKLTLAASMKGQSQSRRYRGAGN